MDAVGGGNSDESGMEEAVGLVTGEHSEGTIVAARKIQVGWVPHQDPYKRARSAFSVAHMSNAKWRKVLRAIATAELGLTRSEWKCIDSEYVMVHGMPRLTDIMEARFADGQFQPFEYKWIEWVRFPRVYKPHRGVAFEVTQDIEGLMQVLQGCGALKIEVDENGLTLFAYGR
jgi:hypothetical protein